MKQFKVGERYRYSEITDLENVSINDYGPEYLGQNAIHIRYEGTETDVWFIYVGQGNEGIMQCVYNN